jgi:hypothetical protein
VKTCGGIVILEGILKTDKAISRRSPMQFQARSSSSAVLVALCTLLMGGCGGGTVSEERGTGADRSGDALGGASSTPNSGTVEEAEAEEGEGVKICHIPPGNPANAHTITVGEPAVKAHLRHGDTLGECGGSPEPEPDAGTPPTDPDAGTPPTDPDAGTPPTDPGPTCGDLNEACGNGTVCCGGLTCRSGFCAPDIN